jgi:hypothetical protein
MKIRNIIVMIAFAGVVTIFAQPEPGEGRQGKMPMMPPPKGAMGMQASMENSPPMMMDIAELQKLMAEIDLDKTVSARIISIARTFLKALDERILKIQREELTIKEELFKDKPDLTAIKASVNRKTQVLGDIEYLQIKRDLDIKSLLSADEYDRWKSAMMQKMRQMAPGSMNRHWQNEGGDKTNPPPKPQK